VQVELSDKPNVNKMAEVTRPARQIEQRYKEKNRTHRSGRKKLHEPHERVYKNWKTPVLFAMILEAGRKTKTSRGLSSTAIAKHLQAREPKIFADLSATTIQAFQIWKKSVLESAKVNGNTPGHDKGGRRGALVS
jgi:hypothetical protein